MSYIKNALKIRQYLIAWFSPLILLPILIFISSPAGKCAYVVFLMSFYWFTEAIPMSVTALLPIVLFPLFGILSSDITCIKYFNATLMVFLGSLVSAVAVEKSGLHQRLALRVILLTGTSPKRLLFGLMITTCLLAMFISTFASTALMIPIINSALDQLKRRMTITSLETHSRRQSAVTVEYKNGSYDSNVKLPRPGMDAAMHAKMRKAIYLGILYAVNIGGTGTLTGTPPNLILNGMLKENPIKYSDWLILNVPGMLIMVILSWLYIVLFYMNDLNIDNSETSGEDPVYHSIKNKYERLGSITFHELSTLILFLMLIFLWLFRDPDFLKGWAPYIIAKNNFINDSCPAILIVICFFLIPADPKNLKTSPKLLDWRETQEKVSWGILLLLGGGFAMAEGCEVSGLSAWIGTKMSILEDLPKLVIVIIICLIAITMTEVLSNAATCTILLPVIKEIALVLNMNPLSIMMPVTLTCSFAYMLPAASGPNAIIFEASNMKITEMMIPGLVLKFVCLAVTLIMISTYGTLILDLSVKDISNQTNINI